MEKNLPGDNLEKFLQKAFDQFEGQPSDGLWDQIEARLPAGPVVWYATWRTWALGAAAALLAGLLIFQQWRHAAHVEQLAAELDCTRSELAEIKEHLSAIPPAERQEQQATPNEFNSIQQDRPSIREAVTPLPGIDEPSSLYEEEKIVNPGIPAFAALPLSLNPLAANVPALAPPQPAIQVLKAAPPKKWTLGATGGLANTTFKGKKQPDPGPGHHEPVRPVDNEAIRRSQSVSGGLCFQYNFGSNWLLETGLQYRRFDVQYTHQPDLKFGERDPHGNPHEEHTHEFGYYLNSPSGTMYVSLSAEQTDPNESISNQENLQVEITTNETIELLSIPVVVGYQIGKNRLSGLLKAGLMANIGLNHQLDVSGLNFRNQKFRPHAQNGARIESSRLNPVSFDYFLGAGLAFDITPSWQVSLMPSVSGSLTTKIDALFQDPTDITVGLTAGLGYRF
ncbi:MAG: outer membrane beta-barrel protein [Saprospiraceae bacterium]